MSQPNITVEIEKRGDLYVVSVRELGGPRSGFTANTSGEHTQDVLSFAPWSSQPFKIRASVEVMAQMIIQELEELP